jgi:hypothetical protein
VPLFFQGSRDNEPEYDEADSDKCAVINSFFGNVKDQGIPERCLVEYKCLHEGVDQAHKDEEGDRKDNNFVLGFHEVGSRFNGFVGRKGLMMIDKCCSRMIR